MGDLKIGEGLHDTVVITSASGTPTDGLNPTCRMVKVATKALTSLTVDGIGGGTGAYYVTDFSGDAAGVWLTLWAVAGNYIIHYPYKEFKVGGGRTEDNYGLLTHGTYGLSALKTLIDAIDDYVDTEVAAIEAETASIKAETDKWTGSDVDTESAALNIYSGEQTLFTIATTKRLEILGAFCSLAGSVPVTAGATITVRVYLTINSVEHKIASNTYVKDTDPNGIIIIDSIFAVAGNFRVTLQSNNASDTATKVPYQHVTRVMEV